jgi:hypothetical protein
MKKEEDKDMSEIPVGTLSRSVSQSQNIDSNADVSQKPSLQSSKMDGKKKKFSLGTLMRPGSDARLAEKGDGKQVASSGPPESSESSQRPKTKGVPTWISQITNKETTLDENRLLALEFLQQAVMHIPERKYNIVHDAIARNLESGIYQWASRSALKDSNPTEENGHWNGSATTTSDDEGWIDKYWEKIHDTAASISGKHETGTLALMIADGKVESPSALIDLADDDLLKSFMGEPLVA